MDKDPAGSGGAIGASKQMRLAHFEKSAATSRIGC